MHTVLAMRGYVSVCRSACIVIAEGVGMSGMPNGMIALPSMLDELFSFRTYEIHSADDNEMFDEYHFWGIVLKKDIGPHKANTWFRAAVILDQFRILELYGEHPFIPVSSYNISLNFTPREPDNE